MSMSSWPHTPNEIEYVHVNDIESSDQSVQWLYYHIINKLCVTWIQNNHQKMKLLFESFPIQYLKNSLFLTIVLKLLTAVITSFIRIRSGRYRWCVYNILWHNLTDVTEWRRQTSWGYTHSRRFRKSRSCWFFINYKLKKNIFKLSSEDTYFYMWRNTETRLCTLISSKAIFIPVLPPVPDTISASLKSKL